MTRLCTNCVAGDHYACGAEPGCDDHGSNGMPDPRQVATALGIDYDALMLRMHSLGTAIVGCHRTGFPACQMWGRAPLAEIKTWLCPDHRPIDLVPADPSERPTGRHVKLPLLERLRG